MDTNAPERPYPGFRADMDKARENYKIIGDSDGRSLTGIRIVEAEAGTGSRYVVVVTALPPEVAAREGGSRLVSVIWPWQDCKIVGADVEEVYVAEHLTAGRGLDGRLHGGDLAALTLTIRRALGRMDD